MSVYGPVHVALMGVKFDMEVWKGPPPSQISPRWCSRDYGVMGVLNSVSLVPSNFQRPLVAKLCRTRNVFGGETNPD